MPWGHLGAAAAALCPRGGPAAPAGGRQVAPGPRYGPRLLPVSATLPWPCTPRQPARLASDRRRAAPLSPPTLLQAAATQLMGHPAAAALGHQPAQAAWMTMASLFTLAASMGGVLYYMARTTWEGIEPFVFYQSSRAAQVGAPRCRCRWLSRCDGAAATAAAAAAVTAACASPSPILTVPRPAKRRTRCCFTGWTSAAAASSAGQSCSRPQSLRREHTGKRLRQPGALSPAGGGMGRPCCAHAGYCLLAGLTPAAAPDRPRRRPSRRRVQGPGAQDAHPLCQPLRGDGADRGGPAVTH